MFIRDIVQVKPVRRVWSAAMRTEDMTAEPRTVSAKAALTSAFVLAVSLAGQGRQPGNGRKLSSSASSIRRCLTAVTRPG